MKTAVLYWSRRDFRLTDNPALSAALQALEAPESSLLPFFILENYMCAGDPNEQFGYPQRAFLSRAIPAFASKFQRFSVYAGNAISVITALSSACGSAGYVVRLFVNDDVHSDFYEQIAELKRSGLSVEVCADQMTVPAETSTGEGKHYSVFTPFKNAVWKQWLSAPVLGKAMLSRASYVDPGTLGVRAERVDATVESLQRRFSKQRTFIVRGNGTHLFDIQALADAELSLDRWYTTEEEVLERFASYCEHGLRFYADKRDSLGADVAGSGTSRMSLALTWGLVSARYLRAQIQREFETDFLAGSAKSAPLHELAPIQFLSELIWREFYKYLFFHDPSLMDTEFQERFRGTIQWVEEGEAVKRFEAWIRGETGYPLVDAAMKQIAEMGWMHNRARMVVASVLTKNLGVDWRWGQEYFRAQLLDLDEASNNGGWQWGASVGADPKPIRIFNPYLQAKNYDPDDAYQKRWLGQDFRLRAIEPIVDHATARTEALARYGLRYSRAGLAKGKKNASLF